MVEWVSVKDDLPLLETKTGTKSQIVRIKLKNGFEATGYYQDTISSWYYLEGNRAFRVRKGSPVIAWRSLEEYEK